MANILNEQNDIAWKKESNLKYRQVQTFDLKYFKVTVQ